MPTPILFPPFLSPPHFSYPPFTPQRGLGLPWESTSSSIPARGRTTTPPPSRLSKVCGLICWQRPWNTHQDLSQVHELAFSSSVFRVTKFHENIWGFSHRVLSPGCLQHHAFSQSPHNLCFTTPKHTPTATIMHTLLDNSPLLQFHEENSIMEERSILADNLGTFH